MSVQLVTFLVYVLLRILYVCVQFEMSSGQYSHPYVSQEVCVIERTIRQEPLAANVLNFGLQQNSGIKSVRGDVNNSLLALIPSSQQQLRSSYQPVSTLR